MRSRIRSFLGRTATLLCPDRPPGRYGLLPPLLVVVTFATGLVDAASFIALGKVFVANMTGNVVFLGFTLAGASGLSFTRSLLALGSFMCGAFAGGRCAPRLPATRVFTTLVGAHAVLVAAALVAGLAGGPVDLRIALLALGMGLQNAVVHHAGVPDLTTTVLTRTLTALAADRPGPATARRVLSVTAMFLGALTGGLLQLHLGIGPALAAALFLLVLVACAGFLTPPPPTPDRS